MHAHSIGSSHPSTVPAASVPQQRRIRCLLFAGAIIGLLSVGRAAAQEAAEPAAAQAPAPAKPGKNGKVCQQQDVTGSRMKKRVCYTPERWQAREAAAKEMVRELDGKSIPKDASAGFQDFNPSNRTVEHGLP
ncbi:hypothetical protein FZO89_05175 [Luteimonas viscosa]|uniref:Uncharacterized protein n=1 Tax=Luteimonas viscosa TaxID=1132694 RepID=A0A5D4XP16_9GAMM|nr:hypothetical protein [Luteimonas viscosa]TYT25695.1 hypothetical protein FZO89_05175 [Luteimonas viscosa]